MNTTTTVDLAHPVVVVTDGQGAYRTECGCGWASDWYFADDLAAEEAGRDHIEIAIGPPDPLDKLLSELLDLQDDLAEAVIWFADNYTADMPVPTLGGRHSPGHPIWLLAATATACGVDQVAQLTGTPPTDDPTPDGSGNRYRRMVHDFGRVRFEVITAIGEATP